LLRSNEITTVQTQPEYDRTEVDVKKFVAEEGVYEHTTTSPDFKPTEGQIKQEQEKTNDHIS
jgi:hypothetical protein